MRLDVEVFSLLRTVFTFVVLNIGSSTGYFNQKDGNFTAKNTQFFAEI